MKRRRSLTNVGGSVDTEGDRADADRLAHALDVPPSTDDDNDPSRSHVHGFHTYPARMHPTTAARLVAAFASAGSRGPSPAKPGFTAAAVDARGLPPAKPGFTAAPGGRVLDPFCGSGTVLVEALIAGRTAVGTDLNPLAVRLAACKTRPRTPAELERLTACAAECAAGADVRRKAKAGASRRFPQSDVTLFEPHVLLELDSLRVGIEALRGDPARADLELILSALLVKLSRKPGDTSANTRQRRTAAGFAARQFVQKAEDLAVRLAALGRLLPKPPPSVAVFQDDATELKRLSPEPVAAIITSPPYAATYDYLAHHELRLRWLGLDASPLARGEIGSRSAYSRLKPGAARAAWAKELDRFFRAAARVLPANGPLVVMMADSAVGDAALRADEIVAEVARACGLVPSARASQSRPHFHGPTAKAFRGRPRAEHALLLRKG